MAHEEVQRRLAAILAADVVGFSRLMEADEAGTLAALKSRRKEILEPLVTRLQGRIFKVTGDGVLVEFASAVNAVQCAVDLQLAMATANADQPQGRQIVLRIGVNLGDVIVEGGDLYGDGVNIAARLEGQADPGGILVSGTAYDHIKSKVKVGFEDLGTQVLKNIAEPVRALRVTEMPAVAVTVTGSTNKPAIAVLPFSNMSGDPEQEYFSDGLTEDIITELSRFNNLLVVARNSSFVFKGQAVDVKAIGRKLGVGYIVEGSVRKMANMVRITAQLIETANGNHVWSEKIDRHWEDIFAVQDEVLHSIVVRLEGRLASSLAQQARRKPTEHVAAYDCVLQARQHLFTYATDVAKPLLRRALDLDPNYAHAHMYLAWACVIDYFDTLDADLLDAALRSAKMAVTLDSNDSGCHETLGYVRTHRREFDEAGISLDRAMALNPNNAEGMLSHAQWLCRVGRLDESLARLDLILQRDPIPPNMYWECRSVCLLALRRYEEAIQSIKKLDRLQWWHYPYLAACHAMLDKTEACAAAVAETLRLRPDFTIELLLQGEPFKNPSDAEPLLEGLRKAGLPERGSTSS